MPMSPRLLRPRASGATHPEALDWASRVTANGGTVSSTTLAAVSTFCASIQAAGIRDRFYRLNLFAGENLLSALVPLYRNTSLGGSVLGNATDTNVNFTSSDYANTGTAGGLTGASDKVIRTGILVSALPQLQTAHWSTGVSGGVSVSSDSFVIGTSAAGYAAGWFGGRTASSTQFIEAAGVSTSFSLARTMASPGRWIGSRTSSDSLALYVNGTSLQTNTSSNATRTSTAGQLSVFNRDLNFPASFTGRLHYYSFGDGVNATQAAAFDAAIAAFLTTMGRA